MYVLWWVLSSVRFRSKIYFNKLNAFLRFLKSRIRTLVGFVNYNTHAHFNKYKKTTEKRISFFLKNTNLLDFLTIKTYYT